MNHCVWSFQTSCYRIDAGNTSLDPVFSCDPVGGRLKRQTKTKCRLAKTIRKRTSCARVRTISSSNTLANSCASSHYPPRQTGSPPSAARWFSRLARLFSGFCGVPIKRPCRDLVRRLRSGLRRNPNRILPTRYPQNLIRSMGYYYLVRFHSSPPWLESERGEPAPRPATADF